jgi:hypothetical protein
MKYIITISLPDKTIHNHHVLSLNKPESSPEIHRRSMFLSHIRHFRNPFPHVFCALCQEAKKTGSSFCGFLSIKFGVSVYAEREKDFDYTSKIEFIYKNRTIYCFLFKLYLL